MATGVTRKTGLGQLAMTTALSGMAMFSYGRGAFAGTCTDLGGSYLCEGAAAPGSDTGQSLFGAPLVVTTSETFAITVTGSAITLNGGGGLTFDVAEDWTGYIAGSDYGILATNYSGGNIRITTTGGEVSSSDGTAIRLDNRLDEGNLPVSTITIATGDVTAGRTGIDVSNDALAEGDSSITVDTTLGSVTTGGTGIFVSQSADSDDGNVNLTVLTGDVTSDGSCVEVNAGGSSYSGDANVLINTTGGTVDSDGNGIIAFTENESQFGDANIAVLSGPIISGNTGVEVSNSNNVYSGDTNVDIDTTGGTIQSNYTGILVTNRGETGADGDGGGDSNLTITAGAITAGGEGAIDGDGIDASQRARVLYGDADLQITATGLIEAEGMGIDVYMNANAAEGNAHVDITTGDIDADRDGVTVEASANAYDGASIRIDTTGGSVTAGSAGVYVSSSNESSYGGSSIAIETRDVTADTSTGIGVRNNGYAYYGNSNIDITTTGGTVDAGQEGIDVVNNGRVGRYYEEEGNDYSYGEGDSNVTITTDAIDAGNSGIRVLQSASVADGDANVTVETNGAVVSDYTGIYVNNGAMAPQGTSNVIITTSTVTASRGEGISVTNEANAADGSDVRITTTGGTVSGGDNGIRVRNDGVSSGGSSDIWITTGAVTGYDGIDVSNDADTYGNSSITIDAQGAVTGQGANGIYVSTYARVGSDTNEAYSNVTVTVTDVTGQSGSGISINNRSTVYGSSDVSVTASGTVRGIGTSDDDGTYDGIRIRNTAEVTGTSDVTVTTNTGSVVTAVGDGILVASYAEATGGADIDITSRGTITSTGDDGIDITHEGQSSEGTANITVITGGDVTAEDMGIEIDTGSRGYRALIGHEGATISVSTVGATVTSETDHGIDIAAYSESEAGYTDITVTTGIVNSVNEAIRIDNRSTGYLGSSVTVDSLGGALTSTSGKGILVETYGLSAGTSTVSITTGNVTGAEEGMLVENRGNAAGGTDITIDTSAGTVEGGSADGITAVQQGLATAGTANLSITTRDVTSSAANGISAEIAQALVGEGQGFITPEGPPLPPRVAYMSAGGLTGSNLVIDTTEGTVTAENGTGISARNLGISNTGGSSITIGTAAVTAGKVGLEVLNAGYSGAGNTDVAIDTTMGDVSGGNQGIAAGNIGTSLSGTGHLTITTGTVTGTAEDGIFAGNGARAGGNADTVITTTAGTVSSTDGFGIYALHASYSYGGTSDMVITTGDVTTQSGTAIYAALGTADFELDEDERVFVQGGQAGSNLTIDTTRGTVSSVAGAGIVAVNAGRADDGDTDLTLRTGDVLLGNPDAPDTEQDAIIAFNTGTSESGTATITVTTGDSDIRSSGGRAIYVTSRAQAETGSDITVDASGGSVISTNATGILVDNYSSTNQGTSNITITTTGGEVVGGGGIAINAVNRTDTGGVVINAGDSTGPSRGILAVVNGTGDLSITSHGEANAETGYGIFGTGNGGGATSITVASGGAARGGNAGVYAFHDGAASFAITNAGTVENASEATDALAIRAVSGDNGIGVTLTNQSGGEIFGEVILTNKADTFDNFGLWDTSGGTSDFGDGEDVLNNGSLLTLVVGNGAANQVTEFVSLETFENSGRIDFLDGFASDRLITSGDFNALPGSFIEMDFVAGGDGAGADVFEIGGDVAGGTTEILVRGVEGTGDLTGWAQNDGIALVRVAGATDAGDFVLDGPAQVNVFLYNELVLGTDNVWRLQSQYLPVIPEYEVYPQALLALSELGTYRERRGARAVTMGDASGTEIWLQIEGRRLERGSAGSTSVSSYEQQITSLTLGSDMTLDSGLVAGVNLRFSNASTTVASVHGDGVIDTTGWSLGATLTWHGSGGIYVDGQARFSSFDTDMRGVSGNSGDGQALSLEVGRQVGLQDGWTLVPQAQLSYTSASFDSFTGTSFEETVELVKGESLLARLGVSIDREWAGAGDTTNRVYGMFNLAREFADGPGVTVNQQGFDAVAFDRNPDGTRVEIGLGGSFGLANGSFIFGDLTASQDVDARGNTDMSGRVGITFTW